MIVAIPIYVFLSVSTYFLSLKKKDAYPRIYKRLSNRKANSNHKQQENYETPTAKIEKPKEIQIQLRHFKKSKELS